MMGEGQSGQLSLMSVAAVALLVLAVAVLTMTVVIDEFGIVLRDATNTSINNLTMLLNTNVSVGATGEFPLPQTLTGCINGTDNGTEALAATSYTLFSLRPSLNGGVVQLLTAGAAFNGTGLNCSSLNYLASTTGSAAASTFATGLIVFATFAAVIALAIVGKLIVTIFKKD